MYIVEPRNMKWSYICSHVGLNVCFVNQPNYFACKNGRPIIADMTIVIFLSCGIFRSASRTWCDGNATGPLARASFDLHKKYGAMFDCDYRALDTLEVCFSFRKEQFCTMNKPKLLTEIFSFHKNFDTSAFALKTCFY